MMVPPLVLDIDGTLTTPAHRVDPRVFELLPDWDAPVVFATGKAYPYPVALASFLGLDHLVIAENGGVVHDGVGTRIAGDPEACWAVVNAFIERGGEMGWDGDETVNRWRETEVALSLDVDGRLLRETAAEVGSGIEIVDTGYAYHVKSASVTKGEGLELVTDGLGLDAEAFVAVGDSINDVSTFERAGESYAVANADADAREAADYLLEDGYMDGTASVLAALREGTRPE